MENGRLFGMPAWLVLVTLGGAGVVGYLLFFRNQGASSNTGSTGYSSQGLAVMQNPDESATMAAQNQLLYAIGNAMQSGFADEQTSLQGINTNIQGGDQGILATLGGLQGDITEVSGQVQQVTDQNAALGGWLNNGFANLSGQVASGQNANNAYYSSLIANMQNYYSSLSSQVGNVSTQNTGTQQWLSNYYQWLAGQLGTMQQQQTQTQGQIAQSTGYLANLDQAGINATWSQYATLMHEMHAPGY